MGATIKPLNANEVGAISDLHAELAFVGDFVLTKKGSLIGAIALEGRDPDGLVEEDFQGISHIGRAFYQTLDHAIITTQYFAHFDGAVVGLQDRDNPVSNKLSKSREAFINSQELSSSSLVHYFEILPDETLSKLDTADLAFHLIKSVVSKDSWEAVKRHFSKTESLLCYFQELERQAGVLEDTLNDACSRWDNIVRARRLSIDEIWAHMKFVANLDPYYLSPFYEGEAPNTGWDTSLSDGDVSLVNVRNMDAVKIQGSTPQYVRLLAVNKFGTKSVPFGEWANHKDAPSRQRGNYMVMMRFHPLSRFQKSMLFGSKERELNRAAIDFRSLLSSESRTEQERRDLMKPAIREALIELGEAEMVEDIWGKAHGFIAIWSDQPRMLARKSLSMKRSADRAELSTCWESAGIARAFKTLQPGGREQSLRDIDFTSTQFSAASLFYRSCEGQPYVEDLKDESQYVFMGDDGAPFYYSPFVQGRAIVIGVGPIRSGKSFLKNTVGSHFSKYGGSIHGIDIDEGMTPVALSFGEDGSVFEITEEGGFGFNSFAVCRGQDDSAFVQHYRNQVILMLASNDNEDMKRLTAEEQKSLDHAIQATMRLRPNLQRLSTVISHCDQSLQNKMNWWVHNNTRNSHGMYARYFDAAEDSVGSLDQRVVAYNLRAVKDDPVILPIVMNEIFFRVTRLFESIEHRDVPKFLDVDEAHAMLQIPYVLNYLVRSVRTWGKYMGGVGLWSQSPQEFADLKHWPALRSAASTFFFMADPQMDVDLYRSTFQLSEGECDAIRNLRPKREAFIVQRDLSIAKKVILEVEPEQYVVSTSNPRESVIRRRNLTEYGFEEGIRRTIEELGLASDRSVRPESSDEEVA